MRNETSAAPLADAASPAASSPADAPASAGGWGGSLSGAPPRRRPSQMHQTDADQRHEHQHHGEERHHLASLARR